METFTFPTYNTAPPGENLIQQIVKMRIVSGPSLLFASLALSGSSYAAPAATSPRGSDSTATAAFPTDRAFLETKFSGNPARSDTAKPDFDNVVVVDNILKPVELIPCGLRTRGVPLADCPDLNNAILSDYQPSSSTPRSTPVPRDLPTTTEMISSDRPIEATSYPPTEPSSVYELDPTPSPETAERARPEIPVISAIPPSVPGGPTITAIIGHLSIVLDHPPTHTPSPSVR